MISAVAPSPKPTDLTSDIRDAVTELVEAVRADMLSPTRETAAAVNDADCNLDAAILKRLRGEA